MNKNLKYKILVAATHLTEMLLYGINYKNDRSEVARKLIKGIESPEYIKKYCKSHPFYIRYTNQLLINKRKSSN